MAEHSLEKPSFVTAGTMFAFWGGGVVVMQTIPPLFWIGVVICFGSAILTIWRYARPLSASIAGSTSDSEGIPRWETISVSILLVVEVVGGAYLAAPAVRQELAIFWDASKPKIHAEFGKPPTLSNKKIDQPPVSSQRVFVTLDPIGFYKLFSGMTQIQRDKLFELYQDKWMANVTGTVTDVSHPGVYLVSITLRDNPNAGVFLSFDESAADRVLVLQKGDQITVTGQIAGILTLQHCELTSVRGATASRSIEVRRVAPISGVFAHQKKPHTVGEYSTSGANIDPCIPERNADVNTIEAFVYDGEQLQRQFVQNNEASQIADAYTVWLSKAGLALKDMRDSNIKIAEFDKARGNSFVQGPPNHDQYGTATWREFAAKIAILKGFDADLKKEVCPAELLEQLRSGKF